jgi:hypothetical protein
MYLEKIVMVTDQFKDESDRIRRSKRDRSDPLNKNDTTPATKEEGGDVQHVVDTGLPPGIESSDLFDPNKDRPRGVPNGDNS